MSSSKEKFITLKEASEISGYAPDYIGQLIRSGKIEGKQIYSNVAWVTTESAIRAYSARTKNGGSGVETAPPFSVLTFVKRLSDRRFYKAALIVLIGIGVVFGLILFYILSVQIDHALERRAKLQAEQEAETIPVTNESSHVPL